MKYKVKIVERLVKVVSVEADDSDEAEWKVQKMYNSEQIILYPENIASVDFVAFKSRKWGIYWCIREKRKMFILLL